LGICLKALQLDAGETISGSAPPSKGEEKAKAARERQAARQPFMRPLFAFFRGLGHLINFTFFSSLTRRIVILNLAALAVLVAGIMYLNTFRAGLIDVRVSALRVQGEIISAAVAASATADSDSITVNPDRLLELYMGISPPPTRCSIRRWNFPSVPSGSPRFCATS